ncbi:MAG: hypothetical protein HC808_13030, partial [Candidatus Competibacteraceae bacterium]|nr:hypothetical protein [Candidatus Competibacteraceae bacterium]
MSRCRSQRRDIWRTLGAVITALLAGVGHLFGLGVPTLEIILDICSALV